MNEQKRCYRCGHEFPRTAEFFYRNKARPDGLGSECKTCSREAGTQWARANPEKHRANDKRYRENNAEKERLRVARYHAENPRPMRERVARWMRENRDKRRVGESRRRAQKRRVGGEHTATDIAAQKKRQNGRCYYCGNPFGEEYHVDHVIPLSRGGSDGPENIVIACPTCNLRKNDKLPHEWPEGGRLL